MGASFSWLSVPNTICLVRSLLGHTTIPYLTQIPSHLLVESGGEFGPTWVHNPFSLLELKSNKTWEAIKMNQANI